MGGVTEPRQEYTVGDVLALVCVDGPHALYPYYDGVTCRVVELLAGGRCQVRISPEDVAEMIWAHGAGLAPGWPCVLNVDPDELRPLNDKDRPTSGPVS